MATVSAFKIKCPSCEAMVTIRDPKLIGKKVDCPKCKFRFVVEAPAEAPADASGSAETAKLATTTTATKEKPKNSAAPSVKAVASKNKPLPKADAGTEEGNQETQPKKNGRNKTLIIGGGIGALAIVALLIAVFSGDDPPKPKPGPKGPGPQAGKTLPKTVEPKKELTPDKTDTDPKAVVKTVDLVAADITNLLPGDSRWVMRINGKQFLDTAIGGVFFDDSAESAKFFKRWMGFDAANIECFACAGTNDGAVFGVIRTNKDIKFDDLQNAMKLESTPKSVHNREMWTIESNELFTMLRDYLAKKIEEFKLPLPKGAGPRSLALSLTNPRTLVIGDQSAVASFLEGDMKRKPQMLYRPADAFATTDKKGDATKKTGSKPPKAGDPETRTFTTNPSFLSVDPSLKTTINQLETDKTCVLAFAGKINDTDQPGANLLKEHGAGFGLEGILLAKSSVVGLVVRRMDEDKLNVAAAIEYPKPEEALVYVKNLRIAATLAKHLTEFLHVPVRSTTGDPDATMQSTGTGVPPRPGEIRFPKDPMKTDASGPAPPITSTVAVTAADKYLVITLDIDWKPAYQDISNEIRLKVTLLKGEALMMTGRAHWHALPAAINRLEKEDGTVPLAAYRRPADPNRLMIPYPPEQRVSWMADLLPYLDDSLSRKVKRDEAWNSEANLLPGSAFVPEFLSGEYPSFTWRAHVSSVKSQDFGATHFVGLIGVGLDSGDYPDTPEYAKQLGMFGYNRQIKFADVAAADGLSNTIFMIQVPPNMQRPWIRGGGATSQGVPLKNSIQPFVCTTRMGQKGTNVLMADGSIRFLSATTNDHVFQALTTYKGGEKFDNIDAIAPAEKVDAKLMGGPMRNPKKEEGKKE